MSIALDVLLVVVIIDLVGVMLIVGADIYFDVLDGWRARQRRKATTKLR